MSSCSCWSRSKGETRSHEGFPSPADTTSCLIFSSPPATTCPLPLPCWCLQPSLEWVPLLLLTSTLKVEATPPPPHIPLLFSFLLSSGPDPPSSTSLPAAAHLPSPALLQLPSPLTGQPWLSLPSCPPALALQPSFYCPLSSFLDPAQPLPTRAGPGPAPSPSPSTVLAQLSLFSQPRPTSAQPYLALSSPQLCPALSSPVHSPGHVRPCPFVRPYPALSVPPARPRPFSQAPPLLHSRSRATSPLVPRHAGPSVCVIASPVTLTLPRRAPPRHCEWRHSHQ